MKDQKDKRTKKSSIPRSRQSAAWSQRAARQGFAQGKDLVTTLIEDIKGVQGVKNRMTVE